MMLPSPIGRSLIVFAGLSMNILRVGERGVFTNSAGDLLLALGFLGGLYNFL